MDRIIRLDEFDFKNSAVIKPKTESLNSSRKYTNVVIDSRFRDLQLYPSPSDYYIQLDDELQDIVSAELIVTQIPFKAYTISSVNNVIRIQFLTTGPIHNVVIPPANYTPSELASTLTTILTALSPSVAFNVTYDALYDKFTIKSTGAFTLFFKDRDSKATNYATNTIGKTLGFKCEDYYVTSAPYTLTAPFRKNFNDLTYIVMHIDNFHVNATGNNSVITKSYAIIPSDTSNTNIVSTSQKIVKYFNPPLPRIQRLHIQFKDINGNLYDFQNHDHRIEILFESYKQARRYGALMDN